jgi:hypothetical protein
MAGNVEARESVEACVKALTTCVSIDPADLKFLWEEIEGAAEWLDEKVETVRVCLRQNWSTLVFRKSEMQDLAHLSERVCTQHREEVLEALRRLKGMSAPVLESHCPDRWVAERDGFPGEPM